ncbi:MAG: 3'-5' exonuclease [Endomicrobiia bacterium]
MAIIYGLLNDRATNGEKRLYNIFKKKLVPDEDFFVWYEPKGDKDAPGIPDFLIYGKDLGILVIEVKDWMKKDLEISNSKKVTYRRIVKKHPLEQAKNYMLEKKEFLERKGFVNPEGHRYARNFRLPYAWGIYFENITEEEYNNDDMMVSTIPREQLLLKKDLDCNSEDFKLKLKNMFNRKFPFHPLSEEELSKLKHAFFPEFSTKLRVIQLNKDCLYEYQEKVITLDKVQEEIVRNTPIYGHRIFKGVVGSGKTIIIASRAKYLKKLFPDWRILVTCFNITLVSKLMKDIYENEECKKFKFREIEIKHFHQVFGNKVKFDKNSEKYGDNILDYLENNKEINFYDAILVDEGQDFDKKWFKALVKILNPKTNSLMIALDPAQNLYGIKKFNWSECGINVRGSDKTFKLAYRNIREITELAKKMRGKKLDEYSEYTEEIDEPELPDIRGFFPTLLKCENVSDLCNKVLELIIIAKKNGIPYSEIAVIYPTKEVYNGKLIDSLKNVLKKKGIPYSSIITQEDKFKYNCCSDDIKLLTIYSSKGLEFSMVVLLGLDEEYLCNEEARKKNKMSDKILAYVGITRAKIRLIMPYINESDRIKTMKSYSDCVYVAEENDKVEEFL